jgi:signal transduction histidine kinase
MNDDLVRTLLVEDDSDDALIVGDLLSRAEGARFDLRVVDTLSSALAHLAGDTVDLVLLDLSLPDSQGLDTFRQLSAVVPGLPIVVLTGIDDGSLALEALRLGAQDYLVKRLLLDHRLPRIVRHAVERKRVEHRRAYERYRLQAVGQLAAGIGFEIHTPLQSIRESLSFLEGRLADLRAEGLEEILTAIRQSRGGVERVSNTVHALTEFAGSGQDGRYLVDVNQAIETTLIVSRSRWSVVADVETDLDRSLTPVPGQALDLRQALLDLIVNAAQAIAGGGKGGESRGTIRIRTRRLAQVAEIRISDNGAGIPPSLRARIFDPCFTTRGRGESSGNGLALVRTVVEERHGGTVRFESEVGTGTTFVIGLPLRPEDTGPAAGGPKAQDSSTRAGREAAPTASR